ncbi:MAG: hypothetical protein AAGH78_02690 [Cyanobacteria bacterium P01_H01_bin.58]
MSRISLVSNHEVVSNDDITENLLGDLLTEIKLLSNEVQQLKAQTSRVVGTKEACQLLGIRTPGSLRYKINSGFLRVGIEIFDRRKPGAIEADWGFDINKCRARLRQVSSKPKKLKFEP